MNYPLKAKWAFFRNPNPSRFYREILWATTYQYKGAALPQPVHFGRHFADQIPDTGWYQAENVAPGSILVGRQRERPRLWQNQTEVTVKGGHFIPEKSLHDIGQHIRDFLYKTAWSFKVTLRFQYRFNKSPYSMVFLDFLWKICVSPSSFMSNLSPIELYGYTFPRHNKVIAAKI